MLKKGGLFLYVVSVISISVRANKHCIMFISVRQQINGIIIQVLQFKIKNFKLIFNFPLFTEFKS
ncbi:hypothetical protein D0809_08270 [Flavobacterium circumlabens]|uniref:Uncharacterized protein n=1 Tax=Flavobacterium circumlabens TaxID=2133765 RepID=A0A4Y7UFG3_9FLAO|nr:hypothetical protein EV142_102528 [Flavobacterium circumlabens]TEB45157.1 hypothetical protein D0809_08270 [Flavobacterium circumlabens]